MISNQLASELAQSLHQAEQQVRQRHAFSIEYEDFTIDDAYQIQDAWIRIKSAEGQIITGRKIGLTSRAMQDAMKIDEPDFGTLFDQMAIEPGATVSAANYCDPRLEAELAFVLAEPLSGETLSAEDVMRATAYVVPALELIDARSYRVDPQTGYTRTVIDTIADNAANAGYVVSDNCIPLDVDLNRVGVILSRNGLVEETGLAGGILGNPARGIAWIARRFARHGIALEPGHIFLAGSFTRPVPARAGDIFEADFGPYGSLVLNFE